MTHRSSVMLGLIVSATLCLAATVYLVAVGARLDSQTLPLSPVQIYLGAGGLLAGVSGLALFLGLALRAPDRRTHGLPAADTTPTD